MRHAYVVNYTGHDLSALRKIDPNIQVVHLSEGNVNVFNVDRCLHDFGLKTMEATEDDFIVLSGAITLNILATLQFIERFGKANILIYHAKRETYVPRTITKEGLSGVSEV